MRSDHEHYLNITCGVEAANNVQVSVLCWKNADSGLKKCTF